MRIPLHAAAVIALSTVFGHAHPWTGETSDKEALRAHILDEWLRSHPQLADSRQIRPVQTASLSSVLQLTAAAVAGEAPVPETAKAFLPFKRLDLRADGQFLYVGSNGLPDHNMMVGITNWQQQVPLPTALLW